MCVTERPDCAGRSSVGLPTTFRLLRLVFFVTDAG
jgi:hypothetical protein